MVPGEYRYVELNINFVIEKVQARFVNLFRSLNVGLSTFGTFEIMLALLHRESFSLKKITALMAMLLLLAGTHAVGHEGGIVFITCEEREMILDTDTARLDITAFRTGEWTRGVKFENGVSKIRFQVITTNYIEGWGIDRESLMAVSHLQVLKKPEMEPVDPVIKATQCTKEEKESLNQI